MNGSEMLIGGGPETSAQRLWSQRYRGSSGGSRRRRGEPHPGALRQPVLAFDHHLLARRQTLRDDGDAVLHRRNLDRPAPHRVVILDEVGVMACRTVLDRLG